MDGLTCDPLLIPTHILDDGCDCTRRHLTTSVRGMARHMPTCSVQPIYANLYRTHNIDTVLSDLHAAAFAVRQSINNG